MTSSAPFLRIARRELAGGLSGFWIYLGCLALGAWAIAAAGSITASLDAGLTQQSHRLLGGDAAVTIVQRAATAEERAFMEERGRVSEAAQIDLMARAGQEVVQADVRAIDGAFPLVGAFGFDRDIDLPAVLRRDGEAWGVAASANTLEALKLRVGDRFALGPLAVELRAVLASEPDRIGEPGLFEPRIVISIDALREAGLMQPGAFFRTAYRLILDPDRAAAFESDLNARFEDDGLRYRSPEDAIDGLRAMVDMLNTFMTVIGISALVAGGVGVALASATFLESRIDSIAALKALGADSNTLRAAYGVQLAVLAGLGAGVGVLLGAASPWILQAIAGPALPLPMIPGVHALALAKAFALTLLSAAMFAAPQLGRARATPPAALFRREGGEALGPTPWAERVFALLAALGLVAVALAGSPRPLIVLFLLCGAALAYGVLTGAAMLVKRLARAWSRRARGRWRLVLASLGGPGSLAPIVAPALGLGLSILVLIAVVQTNLLGQITDTAPANAPSVVFRQIPQDEADAFDAFMRARGVDTANPKLYRRAPVILGRVIAVRGAPIDEQAVPPEQRWVTRGETPMTWMPEKPVEAILRSGQWWAADYSGPPLVSVEQGAADGLGLAVGDAIGFRIFGREIEARVANTRKVDWAGFGANVAFILSPGSFPDDDPFHTAIAIIDPADEDAIVAAVSERWPRVLAFQVRRTLETAADLFGQASVIVSALASVVLAAGVLVMFGAFAAAARRRRRESALLKVLGATRPAILALYALEFALAATLAVALAVAMGVAAAHPIVILLLEAQWRFDWTPVLAMGSLAVISAAAGGACVGWATLSHRPARVLRSG